MEKTLDRLGIPSGPCQRAAGIYLLIFLLFFPVFTGFSGYAAITISKYLFFVTTSLIFLFSLILLSIAGRLRPPKPGPCQLLLLGYMLWCCLSALFSPYGRETLLGAGRYDGLCTTLLYGIVFLCVSLYGKPCRCHAIAFAISVSFCCIISVLQLFGLNPLGLFPEGLCYYDAHIKFTSEFLGTIGNVNLLSAVLCLAIPLFSALYLLEKKGRPCIWLPPFFLSCFTLAASRVSGGAAALFTSVLVFAPVFITGGARLKRALRLLSVFALASALASALNVRRDSSGAIVFIRFGALPLLLLAACVLLFILSYPAGRLKAGKKYFRIFFILLSLALLAGLILAALFLPLKSGTIYELGQVLRGNLDDSFGSSRILIWRSVLELIPARPILGGGPGTLALRLDIHFSRLVEETGETLSSFVDNAHNEYLQILADCGIPALLLYLALLLRAFFPKEKRPMASVLVPSVFCYCVQSFFGLGLCLAAPLFWIFLGLMCSRS